MINLRVTERTGRVVTIKAVSPNEQLMVMTRNGVVNRQAVSEIRVIGRATQGVRLVNLDDGDTVMDVARVVLEENGEELGSPEAASVGEAGAASEAGSDA